MSEPIITTGQLPLTALLLALITVLLNHLLANTRYAKNKRADQAIKLIEALQPELDAIIQTDKDCAFIMTDDAYMKHDSAVQCFLLHLAWLDKFRLKRLWHKLAMVKWSKKQQIPFYTQYADNGSLDKRRQIRPVVEKRIQDIISFAAQQI